MKPAFPKILLTCTLLITSLALFAQNKSIDSLQKILLTQKEDTTKVNTLNALAAQFRYSNLDTAIYFATNALAMATKLNYEMGVADSKVRMGALCASSGKFDEGLKYCNDALIIYNKLISAASASDKEKVLKKMASAYAITGHNSISQGNYPEGLKNSFIALKLREELGDKKGMADMEFNIGNIYLNQHNYTEALRHYSASLKLSQQLGMKADIGGCYNAIGTVNFEQGKYPEALNNYSAALKLAEEAADQNIVAEIYLNLAVVNDRQANYNEALKYNFAALKIFGETGINEQIPLSYNSIALVFIKQKKYNDASEYLNKALSFAKEIGHLDYIRLSYHNHALLDSSQGNYKKALEHYKLFIKYRDSLLNTENTKKTVQLQMQYEFDKKQDSVKAAQERKDIIHETEIKNHKLIRNFSFAGTFAILAFGSYSFYRFRRKKQLQNQQALMNERFRISRELHDEVGATLSGIAMYSHLTKEQIKNAQTKEVEKSLNIMQQSAGEMVSKLNDIVWLINPEQDSLQKLIQRLEEYARDMAMIKDMQVKVNLPTHLAEHSLPVESRRNIYLFCKEAINNAVKYSNGTLLEVSIKETDGKLEFAVSDNGKGFDAVTVRRGNGLENMQKRADEIGAKLTLHSRQDEGAMVSMEVKI